MNLFGIQKSPPFQFFFPLVLFTLYSSFCVSQISANETPSRDEDYSKKFSQVPSQEKVLESMGPILSVFEDLMTSWIQVATDFVGKTITAEKEASRYLVEDNENVEQVSSSDSDSHHAQEPQLRKKVVDQTVQADSSQENKIIHDDEIESNEIIKSVPEPEPESEAVSIPLLAPTSPKLKSSGVEAETVAKMTIVTDKRRRRKKRCSADAKSYYEGRGTSGGSSDYYSGQMGEIYQQNPGRRPGWKRRRRSLLPC